MDTRARSISYTSPVVPWEIKSDIDVAAVDARIASR